MKIIKSKNKNYWSSISILIILSILFSLSSCHNIRYTTKKWDVQRDLVNLNSKNNINVLINIESLNDSLLLIKTYTKDSVMIAREILPKKNLSQIDSTCQYLGLQCIGENRYWYPNGKIKKIILRVLLDTLGTPVKIRYDSDNSIYFVNEIIRVFQNNKLFIPAKIDGYPEFLWVTIPVNFLLRIF